MAEAAKEQSKPKKSKQRIHTLDELRGLAVFCMVFYHAFYTAGVFFNVRWGIDLLNFFSPAEPFFAGLFILISGISSQLSHSNLERGCKLLFIAFAVTVVTFFVAGNQAMIRFGILHMLSICMIAFGLTAKIVNIIPMWIGFGICIILFILTYNITSGYIGISPLFSVSLPTEWYQTDVFYVIGFPSSSFKSSDYFPVIPWIFIFFSGTYLGKAASTGKFPKFSYKKRIPFFSWLGRHALVIYIVHQPVIWCICYTVKWIMSSVSVN